MKRLVLVGLLLSARAFAQTPSPSPSPSPGPASPAPNVPDGTPRDPDAPPAEPTGAAESAKGILDRDGPLPLIDKISFRGNSRTEDEAIAVNLVSEVGAQLDTAVIREDVRALWRTGFFQDVQVDAQLNASGGVELTYILQEKPSVRKVYIAGNLGVSVDKINEVLDLKIGGILDNAQVIRNLEKIRELYIDKGYYLSDVRYEMRDHSADEVDIYYVVSEGSKVKVRGVSFVGNHAIPSDELRGVMGTQPDSYFSFMNDAGSYREEAFERDIALITAYYYDRGYINVKIGTPEVSLSRDKRYMYITIPLEEGPVFQMGKLSISGDLLLGKEEYLGRIRVQPGNIFNLSKIGQDIVALHDDYKDKGYAYVNVTRLTNIDLEKRLVDLALTVQKGKKVYIERINIRGNTRTRDKVVRRELKISEGELFSQKLLEESRRRVMQLGLFEKVDMSTRRGSSEEYIEVNIEVAERPTGTFQIGAGFSSVENFIAQAQISQNNLFGRGQTLSLQAQLSGLRQLFALRFVEPYLGDSDWTGSFDLFNQTRNFETFNRDSSGGDLSVGYPLSDDVRLFLTYKFEAIDVFTRGRGTLLSGAISSPISSSVISNLFNDGITSSLRASVSWDTRDNRLFPKRGMFHNVSLEIADPWTLSENVFTRWSAFSRYYRPIYGPFIFKINAEAGYVQSRDPSGVPIFERYFVGGINDVRGFRPRTLGPRINALTSPDPNAGLFGFNIGGNLQLVVNSEVEFPIFEKVGISGVVFFDTGNAFNTEERYCSRSSPAGNSKIDPCVGATRVPDLESLRYSAGFGFRWFSPIGPLRFEWGIPLDRQPGEESIVFEFTIGNFF